jgi:hypothetical protein
MTLQSDQGDMLVAIGVSMAILTHDFVDSQG